MDTGTLIAGRYRLVEPIGSGGMGTVWRAVDESGGEPRDVALKQVQLGPGTTEQQRGRAILQLRREAEIASGVPPHRNVVALHEEVEHDGQPWLIMEYVPGRNLAEVVADDGSLPAQRAARIGAQVADALAHLHSRGIVHRDVTPRNVLVAGDDTVKLTDFGISRIAGDVTLTGSGLPVGVPSYFSPEVASGRPATDRTDVFGLGATLYAAVEGHGPWETTAGADVLGTIRRAARAEMTAPRQAAVLTPVLLELLRRRPTDRPTAVRARELLDAVAEGRAVRGGGRRWTVLVAVAAVLLVAAGSVLAVRWSGTERPVAQAAAAPTTAPAAPGLGDLATADPCSLVSAPSLDRFGETSLEIDYGNFDRCDVTVGKPGLDIDAELTFDITGAGGPPEGTTENRDGITVVRTPRQNDGCERTLLLTDGNEVDVTVKLLNGDTPDLCTMADTVTDTALAVLTRGAVPRRTVPFAANSLARIDACTLLDTATLAPVPGLQTATPERAFAGWGCDWNGRSNDADVKVTFDRNVDGLVPDDGPRTRVGNRDAAELADGDRHCTVKVLHRPYTNSDGDPAAERVEVDVQFDAAVPRPCASAGTVAASVVARLPAP